MRRHYKGISINTSRNTHERVFHLLNKHHDQVIVDIPSGSGAFVQRLKDKGFQDIKAIDIENIMEIEHDQFLEGDMCKALPMEDESCDALVCIDGIEHISKQFDFVREVNRILKVDGEFIISTPNISSIRSRWKWLMTGHHHKCISPLDENHPSPMQHIGMISFPEMRYLMHSNGFKITKVVTNQMKMISFLFAFILPFIFFSTLWVYLKTGKRRNLSKLNSEVFSQMFSLDILFGETMIVKAVKLHSI